MLQSGFVIAMAAKFQFADYERPTRIVRRVKRWLIVSRLGADGEHITVSDTGVPVEDVGAAPIGLSPTNTLVGVLVSRARNGDCTFLFGRQRPEALLIAGTFFPADGYVRLQARNDVLRLSAEGRHAHSRGRRDGKEILHDVAHPAPDAELAQAWRIKAIRRPWQGDFYPSDSGAGKSLPPRSR